MSDGVDIGKIAKKIHQPGLKGLLYIYLEKRKLKIKKPIIFSLLLTLYFALIKHDFYELAISLIDQILTIIPNLLGFLLGGYALLIGFGNHKLLKESTKPDRKGFISYYQTFSSIFAFGLLGLILTLTTAWIFSLISKANSPIFIPTDIITFLNALAFFVLSFLLAYSLTLLYDITINIFNLSQSHHAMLWVERMNEEAEKAEKKKEKTPMHDHP